jgi:phytoene dehydrogenase-like protein
VSWDALKDDYAARCLAGWEEYLRRPLRPLRRYPYSPLDIERKLSSMKDGSIKHGDYNPLQMGYFRPNDLCSSTRTPLRGLYVAGASVYPGGMILAGPGYLAAGVVADDLEIARWWREPASVTRARERGYLR